MCMLGVRDEVTYKLSRNGSRTIPKGGHLCFIDEVVVGCFVHWLNECYTGDTGGRHDLKVKVNAHMASVKERCIFEAGVNRPLLLQELAWALKKEATPRGSWVLPNARQLSALHR